MADAGIPRIPPKVARDTAHFWRGGAEGHLQLLRCGSCEYYVHPPAPVCPQCLATGPRPAVVSGEGTLFSYTVNFQRVADVPVDPYVIAIVELDEQPGLRLTTNLADCALEDVKIGMRLAVTFERVGDTYLPLFRPA